MNEVRLIDANALKEELLKEEHISWECDYAVTHETIKQVIDNAPTVEPCKDCEDKRQAEYIRHSSSWHELQALRKFKEEHNRPKGEWIDIENVGANNWCSICGKFILHYDGIANFCPNCGADMRGDTNDKSSN